MEVLSDILRSMRVAGSVYFCDRLEPPWSMEFEDKSHASFHLVREGECWIMVDGFKELLEAGDFVFIKPRVDHTLTSHPPDRELPKKPVSTLLLCGYCSLDAPRGHPLLRALPQGRVIRAKQLKKLTWLKSTLDQLSSEYLGNAPGSEVVVDKLTEVLLVELIRLNFGRADHMEGFIRALFDERVSKALTLLHADPDKHWTIQEVAEEVAMSRSAFAKHFKDAVGQTMFEYLTALRMQRAQGLLRETGLPLYEVANRAGYDSDLAFNKAFKKVVGVTPTQYRKRARNNGGTEEAWTI